MPGRGWSGFGWYSLQCKNSGAELGDPHHPASREEPPTHPPHHHPPRTSSQRLFSENSGLTQNAMSFQQAGNLE
jgi:hypothetical protein